MHAPVEKLVDSSGLGPEALKSVTVRVRAGAPELVSVSPVDEIGRHSGLKIRCSLQSVSVRVRYWAPSNVDFYLTQVVQWIEHGPPKPEIQVRFLSWVPVQTHEKVDYAIISLWVVPQRLQSGLEIRGTVETVMVRFLHHPPEFTVV